MADVFQNLPTIDNFERFVGKRNLQAIEEYSRISIGYWLSSLWGIRDINPKPLDIVVFRGHPFCGNAIAAPKIQYSCDSITIVDLVLEESVGISRVGSLQLQELPDGCKRTLGVNPGLDRQWLTLLEYSW